MVIYTVLFFFLVKFQFRTGFTLTRTHAIRGNYTIFFNHYVDLYYYVYK